MGKYNIIMLNEQKRRTDPSVTNTNTQIFSRIVIQKSTRYQVFATIRDDKKASFIVENVT